MASYLLTGAAGFIGARTAELLLEAGHRVVGVDDVNDAYDPRVKRHRLAKLAARAGLPLPRARHREARRARRSCLPSASTRVLNLAARAGVRASVENPWVYVDANVTGTLNLLEWCRARGVREVRAGLDLERVRRLRRRARSAKTRTASRPISPYAATKKAAEALCYTWHALHGLDVTVLRYFTVYGPAGRPDMSVFRFVRRIREGEPITVYGDGSMARDFTYVDDIARGTIAALRPLGYEIVNLGGEHPAEVRELVATVERALGRKAEVAPRAGASRGRAAHRRLHRQGAPAARLGAARLARRRRRERGRVVRGGARVGEGHPRLSDSNGVRRDLRAITADGAAFSVMVGVGETYLVPFALALGIAAGQASLLATLPMLAGSLLQLGAPAGVRWLGSYRRWVVGCAALQALCFAPLVVAALRGAAAPAVLFAVGAAYWGFGMATGPAWNAWVGHDRAGAASARASSRGARASRSSRCWSGSSRAATASSWGKHDGRLFTAFAGLFATAGFARFVSSRFLAAHERDAGAREPPRGHPRARRAAPAPRRDAGRIVAWLLAMQVVVNVAAPVLRAVHARARSGSPTTASCC